MLLVYYTVEKKERIKTVVVSLWFDVAHLTNGGRETILLNNCQGKKWVFIVVSPSANLSVCQWVGSPRDAGQGDDVWKERYCDISMYYFVEKDQSWVSTPLLNGTPAESSQHVWDTWVGWVVTQDPPSRPPLNHLDFLYVDKCVGVLDWSSILQLGADNGLISSLSKFWVFGLKVPSQETKGLVCSICYPGDMGFPWQIACYVNA